MVYGRCDGGEPGYVATPRIMVALGRCVLGWRGELGFEGGCMTVRAAFGGCDVVYGLLREEGVDIRIVNGSSGGGGVEVGEGVV